MESTARLEAKSRIQAELDHLNKTGYKQETAIQMGYEKENIKERSFINQKTNEETDAGLHARLQLLEEIKQRFETSRRLKCLPTDQAKVVFYDTWLGLVFVALCERYKLYLERYEDENSMTIVIHGISQQFLEEMVWPEMAQLSKVLTSRIEQATEGVVKEYVFLGTIDAILV